MVARENFTELSEYEHCYTFVEARIRNGSTWSEIMSALNQVRDGVLANIKQSERNIRRIENDQCRVRAAKKRLRAYTSRQVKSIENINYMEKETEIMRNDRIRLEENMEKEEYYLRKYRQALCLIKAAKYYFGRHGEYWKHTARAFDDRW